MTSLTRKRLGASALLLGLAVAWLRPSDVVRLVADQMPVLLGRYSLDGFLRRALLTLVGLPLAAWLASRHPIDRERTLRLVLVALATLMTYTAASATARWTLTPRYVEEPVRARVADETLALAGATRRRAARRVVELVRRDRPRAARSYTHAPPGFPEATVTLTTDTVGLRNPRRPRRVQVVVAGDSFTEGSMVSDDETWPARVATLTGRSVYNVGVSGAAPRQYLNNFLAFGADLRPRIVVLLVYEGNDFKEDPLAVPGTGASAPRATAPSWLRWAGGLGSDLRAFYKRSPLRLRGRRWLVDTLGPVRAAAPLPESRALSWMPVAVSAPRGVHYYAFSPKRLLRLYWTPEAFRASRKWRDNEQVFLEIQRTVERLGAQLVFAYAPSKPHAVLPLVRETVPADALRAFAALRRAGLPPAPEFQRSLFAGLDSQESVMREFCEAHGIPFVSTTPILRERLADGVPVYFTYDPHWTRLGHSAVAEALARALGSNPAPARREAFTLPRRLADEGER